MYISTCLECHDDESGTIVSVNRVDEDNPVCEKCGAPNYLVYTNRNPGGIGGDYRHTSSALAMNPSQIAAHHKLFPDVEVSRTGEPTFTSVRQQDKYLDKVGMVKMPQKIRKSRHTKRIA